MNKIKMSWKLEGFLDDVRRPGDLCHGYPVLGRIGEARAFPGRMFVNAIGSDRNYQIRPGLISATGAASERFATLVHPWSSVSPRAELGHGVSVGFGAVVGGGTRVGDHATLGPGCIIGHDCSVGDHSIVAPGAVVSGFVRMGRNCYVGAGASIRQDLRIGDRSLVGLGAVVTRDVEDGITVFGCPARPSGRAVRDP
jgi:sugar O-acyltransferase (sialic acid O-acetyltransferase NeuD family)